MATVRSRVLATLVLSFAFAACSGSPVFAATNTVVPLATRTLLEADLSTASMGWVPVAYGDAQVSVPASFIVVYPGEVPFCGSVRSAGTLFLEPTPTTRTGPGCPAEVRSTLVRLASTRQVPAKYASEKPILLNGVPVYLGPTDELLARYTYYAPSLGVEVTADGPLARQVIGTLARSPRATALALGTAPSVPASWRSVSFSGLQLLVTRRLDCRANRDVEPVRASSDRDRARSDPRHRQGVLGLALSGSAVVPGHAVGRGAYRQRGARSYGALLGGRCLHSCRRSHGVSEQHTGLQRPVAQRHCARARHAGVRVHRVGGQRDGRQDHPVLTAGGMTRQ